MSAGVGEDDMLVSGHRCLSLTKACVSEGFGVGREGWRLDQVAGQMKM
jgi:hypothetical protein